MGTRDELPNGKGGLSRWFPTKDTVDGIYKATPKGSPARKLMVDMHVSDVPTSCWIDTVNLENNNHEFLVDLTVALMVDRALKESVKDKCKELTEGTPRSYHKHGKDEVCGATVG